MRILSTETTQILRRTAGLTTLLLTGLFVLIGAAARADMTITVDTKDGESISDVKKISATVLGSEVDKVEFKEDDKEPVVATSTPYTFVWDTIKDTEGAHKLTITAYDNAGATKAVSLNLTIDNELSKGADSFALDGRAALKNKKPDEALRLSRRALKADADNLAAAQTVAAIYAYRENWTQAIDTLATSKKLETSPSAMLELASYRIRRALIPDNAANLTTELEEIHNLRKKAADLEVATILKQIPEEGKRTAENTIALADALINAARYAEAASLCDKAGPIESAPIALVNRRLLAEALDNRTLKVTTQVHALQQAKKDDAATRIIGGLALLRGRQHEAARLAVGGDLTDQNPAAFIIASLADTGNNRPKSAITEAREAVRLAPDTGEANYALTTALSTSTLRTDILDAERTRNLSLALSSLQPGPILNLATQILSSKAADRLDKTTSLIELVLKFQPDNINALTMKTLLALGSKNLTDAEKLLQELDKNEKKSADYQTLLGIYFDQTQKSAVAVSHLDIARTLDAKRFAYDVAPLPYVFLFNLNLKLHYRSDAFLTPAILFSTKSGS